MAVGSQAIDGVSSLAATYADLVDATRTAQRLDLRGWIPDPEQLALERLLLANPDLADATVRRELGPVLADERFGEELIETLEAYFDAGENVTAAARRLHLATRTVGYRLEKIESLLGHELDGQNRTAPLDRPAGAPPALGRLSRSRYSLTRVNEVLGAVVLSG